MPFKNIDTNIDIGKIMHIDIGKIGQIYFRFTRDFYKGYSVFTEQMLPYCLNSFAKILFLLQVLIAPVMWLKMLTMLNESCNHRKILFLTKISYFHHQA